MTENDTVSWINEQLNKGYSLAQIREKLINSNYLPENADKLLNLAVMKIPKDEISYIQPDKTEKSSETEDYKEYTCINIGIYAGICSLIPFFLVFTIMVFFDNYTYLIHLFSIVLLEAFVVINRSRNSIKKIICSVFISYTSFVAGVLIVLYFFTTYYISYPIEELERHPETLLLIFGIIFGFVLLEIVAVILFYLMKKISIRKINVLKPILIIACIYLLGMGLFCFTGPKIIQEPIEVYWCEDDTNNLVNIERSYENMVSSVTGYNLESYFTQTPNLNNRFTMNKYELATVLIAMINSAAIHLQNKKIIYKFDEVNQTDEYYKKVVKKTEFNLDKLQTVSKDKALILILEGYNSYLTNLKNVVENSNLNYVGGQNDFKDKEQYLKYLQTKIDINERIKKNCKYMNLENEDNSKISYYTKTKFTALTQLISDYNNFVKSVSINIKIVDVLFEDTLKENKKRIIIKLKNAGASDMSCDSKSIKVFVECILVRDIKCDFETLKIGEEGICHGLASYGGEPSVRVKLMLPTGFESIYIYQNQNY